MSTFTIDTVLADRPPGLRERAKAAHAELQAQRAREYQGEAEALLSDAHAELQGPAFAITPAEIMDVEFVLTPYNPSTPSYVFEIDGIKLRARFINVKVMTRKSSEFDDEDIHEQKVSIEALIANSWKTVKGLAQLGAAL